VRLLPLAILPLFLIACSHAARVRQPTPHERARIVAAVAETWKYESDVNTYVGRRLHLRPSRLHPKVVSIRVSQSDPHFASAAVELRDAVGRRKPGTAAIILKRVDNPDYVKHVPEWWVVAGPAATFPLACTSATRKAVRDLLCPDPWSILDYPRPHARPAAAYAMRIRSSDVFGVDWKNITLPGTACGATRPIRLHEGQAAVRSAAWPWWAIVEVSVTPPKWAQGEYGDLDGDGITDEAAVGVVCSNGGGTAAGQLGFSYVIFSARENVLHVIGVITPQQPLNADAGHVPLLGSVEILRGKLLAQEAWYGPNDGTCCPSGRVATIWTYASGKLRPSRTIVVLRPSR
jgi:hypothetical protein